MSLIVQKLRLQRGWSQQQLAELSGLSVRTVQRIEGGQNATAESLKSLAAVFEVDFQELRSALEPVTPVLLPPSETPMTTASNPIPAYTPTPGNLGSMPDDEVRAFKEVRKLRGFYMHAAQYVVVISLLAAFNVWRSPNNLWFLWAAFGWGIGLLSHGLSVRRSKWLWGPDWERRQIESRIGRKL